MRLRRAAGWLGVVVAIELVARAIVYALAPGRLTAARSLGGRLGGPRFTELLLVSVGLAALLATVLVWLAALGVRERWELAEVRPVGPRPRIALRRMLVRAVGLTLAGWLAFASVESIIHLRAGLGFHGLDCLVGPVHRNALPVVAGLAILAAALASAAELLFAWMRRTVARFGRPRLMCLGALEASAFVLAGRPRRARGPPALVA